MSAGAWLARPAKSRPSARRRSPKGRRPTLTAHIATLRACAQPLPGRHLRPPGDRLLQASARWPYGGLQLLAGALARSTSMNARIHAGWSGQARAETMRPSTTPAPSTNCAPAAATSGANAG